jgi:hypothetical protein
MWNLPPFGPDPADFWRAIGRNVAKLTVIAVRECIRLVLLEWFR